MKYGVVDVGGGMRGVYAAGIFDYCLDHNINFNCCIGVSAGSANCASYIARQRGRNHQFYLDYAFRKEYMGLDNYIHNHAFVNFDYIYDDLSGSEGEYPVDYDEFAKNPCDFLVVATNAVTGEPHYFRKDEIHLNDYDALKASCSVPGVNPPYVIDDVPYYDGALSDCIPLAKAFKEGCDKVVLILTKPIDTIRDDKKDCLVAKLFEHEYPKAAKKLENRANHYNEGVAMAKLFMERGKVLILAPDSIEGVDTLKRNKEALDILYDKGYFDAEKIVKFMQE